MNTLLRPETRADIAAIRRVNLEAFDGPGEADLVDALRDGGHVLVSLVAEADGDIIGHILFSRMHIETDEETIDAVSLAPMAVLPSLQGRGIGSALVEAGLDELRERDERIVIVLGHAEYYPRFGFQPELADKIESPWTGSEAFMALELVDGALDGVEGRVRYAPPFGIE